MVLASSIANIVKQANSVAGFGLDPDFAQTLSALLAKCRAAGLDFRIAQGLRTPRRTPAMIDTTARKMERDGAPWLGAVLRSYRNIPRQPNWLTSALPGAGWHQWGLAADCYCYRNGKMVENGSDPAYKFYADEAIRLGLTAGYYFSHQDSGHVQGPSAAGATDIYTWPYIDRVMKERFSDKERVALASGKPASPAKIRTTSATSFPALAPFVMKEFAAAAAGPFYKDDPVLANTRLEPEFFYKLPSSGGTLKQMAQTYNAIGGLVDVFGRLLDIDPVAALAVWNVESSGRAFTPGRPVLRFENHKFFKYWGVDHESLFDKHFQFGGHAGIPGPSHKNHKFRVKPSGPWRPVHIDSQAREYEAFALGERLGGREAASLSSSFGGPQIMGFNHLVCGYASATALAEAFAADQRWQVLGFFDFCRANGLIDEIRNKQWTRFGEIYNGDGATYGPLLKAAFDTKPALLALPKIPNPPAEMIVMAAAGKAAPKPKRGARRSKRAAAKPRRSAKPKRTKRAQRAVAKPKKSRRRAA